VTSLIKSPIINALTPIAIIGTKTQVTTGKVKLKRANISEVEEAIIDDQDGIGIKVSNICQIKALASFGV